jgi:hypothetical protein
VLSNHRYDPAYAENRRKKKQEQEQGNNQPPEEQVELSFAQMEGVCYCCGKAGHTSNKCYQKNKPKSEWVINKTPELVRVQHLMSEQQNTPPSDEASAAPSIAAATPEPQGETSPFSWIGIQVAKTSSALSGAKQEQEMKKWIMLDSESTVDLFCNPEFVTDVTTVHETLQLKTSAGVLTTNKKATVPDYGQVWYHEDAMTNIFSLASMTQKYRVTFDSSQDNEMVVHTDKKPVRFALGPENLYYHKPTTNRSAATTINNSAGKQDAKIAGVGEQKDKVPAKMSVKMKETYDHSNEREMKTTEQHNNSSEIAKKNEFEMKTIKEKFDSMEKQLDKFATDIDDLKKKSTRKKEDVQNKATLF